VSAPKALGHFIFVKRDPYKPTMEDGILIPENAERTPRFAPTVLATVVSCGAKCKTLKPGIRVAVKQHAGDDLLFADQTFTRMREWDIIGLAV
jgi:co-chaperonin GroES (HSP10)